MILFSSEIFVVLLLWLRHLLVTLLTAIVFNWSSNLKILLHMCDTYNCDYLKHSTFRFNLIDFQLSTDFPS